MKVKIMVRMVVEANRSCCWCVFTAQRRKSCSGGCCWSSSRQICWSELREGLGEQKAAAEEGDSAVMRSDSAKALGGLMRSRKGRNEWRAVEESKLWTLSYENGILPALRLSYFHLSPTLKQCSSFCAIFPKEKEIWKQDLIHLWMANGFIPSQGNLDVEEVGNMIWEELYQKSFFQDVRIYDMDNADFKMHDLVHDLAQSVTEQECTCLEEINLTNLPINTHHIGYSFGGEAILNKEAFRKFESLRTLYHLGYSGEQNFRSFPTSIRVLRINSSELSLPGNFSHLRYLELYDMQSIETLPNSIYDLRKLEILKLLHLTRLRSLPKHLSRLQNLRHLFIHGCDALSCMFPNIHKLSYLRTLSEYIVQKETGHSLTELRDLNLGGNLHIKGLENVGSLSEDQKANLRGKENLLQLSLSWNYCGETKSHATDAGQVLEALQPHPNLTVLTITGCEGLHWPSWMGNNSVLSNLIDLTLRNCKICQELPYLGKLPSLNKLYIEHVDCVQYVDGDECNDGVEVRAFPSLESLTVGELENLERLLKMETGGAFRCLSYLHVDNCPKLQLSFLPCVKFLFVSEVNNELLESISCLSSLHSLGLECSEDVTSFPEGMMNNLTNLKNLEILYLSRLKELPCGITKLGALESLTIYSCYELESFPEQGLEGLRSL